MCGNKFIQRTTEYTLLTEDMVQFGGYRPTKGDKTIPAKFTEFRLQFRLGLDFVGKYLSGY
jgi:hypothetical protein